MLVDQFCKHSGMGGKDAAVLLHQLLKAGLAKLGVARNANIAVGQEMVGDGGQANEGTGGVKPQKELGMHPRAKGFIPAANREH